MPRSAAPTAARSAGSARIEWAEGQMPVLRSIRERFEGERPLAGLRVGACLQVTAEAAVLVRTLAAGGAEIALCAANPLTTQPEVATALSGDGLQVRATRSEDVDTWAQNVRETADWGPQLTLDDGADLLTLLHEREAERLVGGVEETRTGLLRLRRLESEGKLRCPVIAVNESRTERTFNDRYC